MVERSFLTQQVFGRGAYEGYDREEEILDEEFSGLFAHGQAWTAADGDDAELMGSCGAGAHAATGRGLGDQGELLASTYLQSRGFEILERKLRNPGGEADIVALDDGCVVLVEVKTRNSRTGGGDEAIPELAVDAEKQRRYRKIALMYLYQHPEVYSVRFDVIAITIDGERSARLRHLVGAFSWDS